MKPLRLEEIPRRVHGMDETVVWVYRHVLRDGGRVKVDPTPGEPGVFTVKFVNTDGSSAVAKLPSDGRLLRCHIH